MSAAEQEIQAHAQLILPILCNTALHSDWTPVDKSKQSAAVSYVNIYVNK